MTCCARLAVLVAGALAWQAAVAAPPSAHLSDEYSVHAYMNSVAWRTMARTCERGVPGYRVQFDSAYAAFPRKNAEALKRGDRLFHRAMNREWKGIPATRVEANEIARAEAALKRSPDEVGPLELNADQRAGCERMLKDLAAGS